MNAIWSTVLVPGAKWSGVVGKHRLLRFTAQEAGANVAVLLFNARDLTERYNMPDTLKAQHTAKLAKGHVLMSDNGRAMASIVEDGLGWHDPLSGCTTRASTDAKYGRTTYQQLRNGWLRSGQENLVVELVRNGLGPRDLGPVVNLFSKVVCGEDGRMQWQAGHCPAGATVALRTEMELLVVLSNTPHPLDPRTPYPSVPVKLEALPAEPAGERDECANFRPENRRAFENTLAYNALLGV